MDIEIKRQSAGAAADAPDSPWRSLLITVVNRCLDHNKRVQRSASGAFATILATCAYRECGHLVVPFRRPIASMFAAALRTYQAKNVHTAWDALKCFCEACGRDISEQECVAVFMPAVVERWNSVADDDNALFPILETLGAVVLALGPNFQLFAQPVYERCTKIMEDTLVATMACQYADEEEEPEKDFLVAALDLISAMCDERGLGGSVGALIGSPTRPPSSAGGKPEPSRFVEMIVACLKDSDFEVRQSGLAVIGDLAAHGCVAHLAPALGDILRALLQTMDSTMRDDKDEEGCVEESMVDSCNNAVWALGEISLRAEESDLVHLIAEVEPRLVYLITEGAFQGEVYMQRDQNTAITLGRIALRLPGRIGASVLPTIGASWMKILKAVPDARDKGEAVSSADCLANARQGPSPLSLVACIATARPSNFQPRDSPPRAHDHPNARRLSASAELLRQTPRLAPRQRPSAPFARWLRRGAQ